MKTFATVCAGVMLLTPLATGQLDLSVDKEVGIFSLGYFSIGDADFSTGSGHLWLADQGMFSTTNQVAEIDPLTGQVFTTFSASVVPGINAGVTGLAIHPTTGNLFLFGGTKAGEVTQAGTLVKTLGGNHT